MSIFAFLCVCEKLDYHVQMCLLPDIRRISFGEYVIVFEFDGHLHKMENGSKRLSQEWFRLGTSSQIRQNSRKTSFFQISSFLQRIHHDKIGVSVFKLFVVDKSAILTVSKRCKNILVFSSFSSIFKMKKISSNWMNKLNWTKPLMHEVSAVWSFPLAPFTLWCNG